MVWTGLDHNWIGRNSASGIAGSAFPITAPSESGRGMEGRKEETRDGGKEAGRMEAEMKEAREG